MQQERCNGKFVYADNAATTPLSERALEAMLPYFSGCFFNPSAVYPQGQEAKKAVEKARRQTAECISARINEIFITSGGTEADNWALFGMAEGKTGGHLVTTGLEHSAVYNAAKELEKRGYEVTYLETDGKGQITPEMLENSIRPDTFLVSIMLANNELGTIFPIKALAETAHKHRVLFHTDAVQAVGHIKLDVHDLGVDFLSLSAHKFGGSKGIGALYVRTGRSLPPLIYGGGQEKGRRSGTQNVPGIIGMAAALSEATERLDEKISRVTSLRDRLIKSVLELSAARLTGDPENRLPGMASFVFEGYMGGHIVEALGEMGICASSGSACSAGSGDPSRVLIAAGYNKALAGAALRLSLSENNTEDEIDYIVSRLPEALVRARAKQKDMRILL